MKNKLIFIVCAVIVMMLCACDSGNVNNAENDVVKVSFAVTEKGAPEKIISIDSPLNNNLIYQYKAIATFKSADGKTPKGSTGDVWTDFPSVHNGASIELTFAKGSWTLDVRGILKGDNYANDKTDYSLFYQTSAPLKISFSNETTKIIIFNVEKTKDGEGFACLNVIAQGKLEEIGPPLLVTFSPIASGETKELTFKKPTKYDFYKAIYIAEDFKLTSGVYLMKINYNNDEAVLGPYVVEIVDKKQTTIKSRIALDTPFGTEFGASTESKPVITLSGCYAYFKSTVSQNVDFYMEKGKLSIPKEGNYVLNPTPFAESQIEIENKNINKQQFDIQKVDNQQAKNQNDAKKAKIAKQLEQKMEVLNEPAKIIEKQQAKELIKDEMKKQEDRGITFKYDFICDDILVDSEQVKWCYNYDTKRWEFSLPAKLFKSNLAEHSLVFRATVTVGDHTLVAESEPVAIGLIE